MCHRTVQCLIQSDKVCLANMHGPDKSCRKLLPCLGHKSYSGSSNRKSKGRQELYQWILSIRFDNSRRHQFEEILVRQDHVTNMTETSLRPIEQWWYNITCSLTCQSGLIGWVVYESENAQYAVVSICMLSSSTLTFWPLTCLGTILTGSCTGLELWVSIHLRTLLQSSTAHPYFLQSSNQGKFLNSPLLYQYVAYINRLSYLIADSWSNGAN